MRRRAVSFSDLTDPDAARLAAGRFARIGVDAALAAAGAQPGDEVRVGDLTFDYSLPDTEDDEEEP